MTFTVKIGSGRPLFPPIPDFRTDPRTAWKPLPASSQSQIKEARKL